MILGVLALVVKILPANAGEQETWVRSLVQEDPPEEEMATHSGILAWRIPWTVDPGRLQTMELQSQTWLSEHISPSSVDQPTDPSAES